MSIILIQGIKNKINFSITQVNRVKEGTGVVISISENDGSNVIRIEGNLAGVLKAQTVCNFHLFVTPTTILKNIYRNRKILMFVYFVNNAGTCRDGKETRE